MEQCFGLYAQVEKSVVTSATPLVVFIVPATVAGSGILVWTLIATLARILDMFAAHGTSARATKPLLQEEGE